MLDHVLFAPRLRAARSAAVYLPLTLFAALPLHAQTLYGATQGANANLVVVNQSTGAATIVGAPNALGAQVSSLAFTGSSLFGGTLDGSVIAIDTATGTSTTLFNVGASPLYGLAFFNGGLYGLEDGDLVSLDLATKSSAFVGTVTDASFNPLTPVGLAVVNGKLVTADAGLGAGGDLYALDATTGVGTDLTASGTGIGINGLSGLALLNGTLYAADNDPSTPGGLGLYTLDTSTAATNFVGANGFRVGALAAVPEPGTLVLSVAVFASALLSTRRRKRL